MLNDIAAQTSLDDEFRGPALQFLISAVRSKKMKIQALKLGPVLTTTAIQIAANYYRENPEDLDDEDDDDDESNPGTLSLQLIDFLSSTLPPSQAMGPLLSALPNYVKSADPAERKAGFLALAMAVEGSDYVASQIGKYLCLLLLKASTILRFQSRSELCSVSISFLLSCVTLSVPSTRFFFLWSSISWTPLLH